MKIRPSILFITVAAAVLIALLFWHGKRKPVETPLSVSTETNSTPAPAASNEPVVSAPTPAVVRPNVPTVSGSTNPPDANAIQFAMRNAAERKREILSTYNDVPIDFYGKLEDQFGNPVEGAEIKATIRVINGDRQGADRLTTTSDADGLFQFHGKGQDIGMMPQKQGYVLSTTETLFKYSRLEDHPYTSDANSPTVVKMRKLQGGERLIHYQTQVNVPLAGTPKAFDLQTGRQVESGGDIIVSVTSSPTPDVRQQYDWQVTVRAVDGGLLLSDKDFEQMFQAPDTGYQPQFVAAYQKGAQSWTTTLNDVFYLTSRSGRCYGKLGIEVLSDVVKNGTIPVILNSYLNPDGSRNLEINPQLMTEAHP
jgi:hypothetical protein